MSFDQVAAMDKWEISHWLAHMRLDPPLRDVLTTLNAVLCSVQANTAFGSTGKAEPGDFLIDWRKPTPSKEQLQMIQGDAMLRWSMMSQAKAEHDRKES